MKHSILSILLLTASVVYAESPNQSVYVYETSEAALIAGSVTNIVQNFQPLTKTTTATYTEICPNLPAGFCGPINIAAVTTTHPEPIGRTIGVSVGTAAAIVAEHFIIRKFPKSKRWLSVINFGAGGAVAYQSFR